MLHSENELTRVANERQQHFDYHAERMWRWHGWISGWTLIANILAPFGLAALLYIPDSYRNSVTLALLGVSGISLALQLLTKFQRFEDRAKLLRELSDEMRMALANYKRGLHGDAEFSTLIDNIMKKHQREPAP